MGKKPGFPDQFAKSADKTPGRWRALLAPTCAIFSFLCGDFRRMDADFLRDPFHASACRLGGPGQGGTDCRAPEPFLAKHEIDPTLGIDLESGQDWKEMFGDRSLFTGFHNPARGIDKFQVFIKRKWERRCRAFGRWADTA